MIVVLMLVMSVVDGHVGCTGVVALLVVMGVVMAPGVGSGFEVLVVAVRDVVFVVITWCWHGF